MKAPFLTLALYHGPHRDHQFQPALQSNKNPSKKPHKRRVKKAKNPMTPSETQKETQAENEN